MSSALAIEPATALSIDDLTELLNQAFVDYLLPIHLAPIDVQSMIARDDILLEASLVALEDGVPVGLALVAMRPRPGGYRARLATMGVLPRSRRAGVGQELLSRAIEQAGARGAASMILEVFAANQAARRLYERNGFVARRRLLGFELRRAELRRPASELVMLRPADSLAILDLYAACTAGEDAAALPSWQLEAPALARFNMVCSRYTIASAGAEAVGYVVIGRGRPAAHLVHLGMLPAWRRRGLATAALARVLLEYPGIDELYLPQLIPADSTLVPFLRAIGARPEPQEQLELELELPP